MSTSPSIRFRMIASGYLVLIKDEQVLLSRRFQTGYQDGMYSLPAGHIEAGETLTAGTCREISEEIGLKIQPEQLELAHVMHRKSDDIRLDFFFTANTWQGEATNCEPNKCDDLRWFPLTKLPENIIPYIHSALQLIKERKIFSEFGWGK